MDYSKLKVAELKELLKERGLSATGLSKKQLIIDALEEDDAETGQPADQQEEEDDAEVELDAKTTKSTRSSKRKATSPTPAAKQAKKPKPEPSAATAVDSPTNTVKPQLTDAQFAPAGANLDIPIDEGVSSAWHVYVDPDSGIIYDASLNQTNASNNNNKFYRVQVFMLQSYKLDISQY
jgi:poly [ADP-ribose] polymerase